jgi:RND superfamily putative drug exporter
MHNVTRHIGDSSARRPRTVIATWLAVLVAALLLAAGVGGSFIDDFVAPGSQSDKAQTLLEQRFPAASDGTALAVFAERGSGLVTDNRAAVTAALRAATKVKGVTAVSEPFTAGTVSADGRTAYAAITFDKPASEIGSGPIKNVLRALRPARDVGLVTEMGGDASFINSGTKPSGGELIGIVAALLILVVAFGAAVAALVPIALALVSVGIGLACVALLAAAFDVSTAAPTIGAMIGLGVGIDYALIVVARYRDNRKAGQPNREALSDAMASVGSAVAFAGITVILAMLALVVTGVGFLASTGLTVSLVVLVTVSAAMTLLPALLTLLGDRIDVGRLRRRRRAVRTDKALEETLWWRFAHRVARRPLAWLLAGTALLLVLGTPALSLRTGFPDAGDDSTSTTHRRAYDLLTDGFGAGINGPMLVVADLKAPGVQAGDIPALSDRIAHIAGVASVGAPRFSPSRDTVVLSLIPTTAPTDSATSKTLDRVRNGLPGNVSVTGLTAMTEDLTGQLNDKLPVFIGVILAAAFLLMMIVFRSVVVPLKAAVMNLLSIGGAYGVLVALFQWGWLQGLTGLDQKMSIVSQFPTLFFAVLFALSVDYEVFLISRIREEYDATGQPSESVARGVATTGRIVTSAALIMTSVFLSFAASPSPLIMMIGIGLAAAVILDATVVRMVLVPASMELLGHANWWLPRWLDRSLPRIAVHAPVVPQQRAPEPLPARNIDLTNADANPGSSRRHLSGRQS